MNTMKDIVDTVGLVDGFVALAGSTGAFEGNFVRKLEAIRVSLFEEQGLSPVGGDVTSDLDPNVPLGPRTEALFQELLAWLPTQSRYFSSLT